MLLKGWEPVIKDLGDGNRARRARNRAEGYGGSDLDFPSRGNHHHMDSARKKRCLPISAEGSETLAIETGSGIVVEDILPRTIRVRARHNRTDTPRQCRMTRHVDDTAEVCARGHKVDSMILPAGIPRTGREVIGRIIVPNIVKHFQTLLREVGRNEFIAGVLSCPETRGCEGHRSRQGKGQHADRNDQLDQGDTFLSGKRHD